MSGLFTCLCYVLSFGVWIPKNAETEARTVLGVFTERIMSQREKEGQEAGGGG